MRSLIMTYQSCVGLGLFTLLLTAIAFVAEPVQAQSSLLTPAKVNLAKPVGAQQGAYQTVTLPATARMNEIVIYADSSGQDRAIYGLEIKYQAQPGAQPSWTPLIGARKGKKFSSFASFNPKRPISKITLWTRNGGPLAGIQFSGGSGTSGIFSQTFSQKQAITLGEGLTFGGLVARTDGEQIYALGVIAIDPDNPSSHPAWANNPVLAYTKPEGTAGAQAQDQATLASQPRQTMQQRFAATLDKFVTEVKRGPVERPSGARRAATTSTQQNSSANRAQSVGSQLPQSQPLSGQSQSGFGGQSQTGSLGEVSTGAVGDPTDPLSFNYDPNAVSADTASGSDPNRSVDVGTSTGANTAVRADGSSGVGAVGVAIGGAFSSAMPGSAGSGEGPTRNLDSPTMGALINVAEAPRLGAAAQNGNVWQFEAVKVGENTQGLVRLKNVETGTYLVHGRDGPKLDTPSRFSGTGMWSVEPSAGGDIRLKSRYNGAYLHVAGGVLTASAVQPDNMAARWSLYCQADESVKSQKPCGITLASRTSTASAAPAITGLTLSEVGYRRQLSQRSVQEGKFVQSDSDPTLWYWQTGARPDTSRRYRVIRRTSNSVTLKNDSRSAASLTAVFEIDLGGGRITGRNVNRKPGDPRNFFEAIITSRAGK